MKIYQEVDQFCLIIKLSFTLEQIHCNFHTFFLFDSSGFREKIKKVFPRVTVSKNTGKSFQLRQPVKSEPIATCHLFPYYSYKLCLMQERVYSFVRLFSIVNLIRSRILNLFWSSMLALFIVILVYFLIILSCCNKLIRIECSNLLINKISFQKYNLIDFSFQVNLNKLHQNFQIYKKKSASLLNSSCYQIQSQKTDFLSHSFYYYSTQNNNPPNINRGIFLAMSGHRAYFKNDNFFLGTKRQIEKKEQQEIQRKVEEERKRIQKIQKQKRKLQKQKADIQSIKDPQQKKKRQKQLDQIDKLQKYKHRKQQERKKKQEQKQQQIRRKQKKIQRENQQIFMKYSSQNSDNLFKIQESSIKSRQHEEDLDFEKLNKIMDKKKQKKAPQDQSNPISSEVKNQSLDEDVNQQVKREQKKNFDNTNSKVPKTNQNDDNDFDLLLEAFKKKEMQNVQEQQEVVPPSEFKRSLFKPKSTLKILLPEPTQAATQKNKKQKSKNELERERRNQDKKLKKQLNRLVQNMEVDEANPLQSTQNNKQNPDQEGDQKSNKEKNKQKDNTKKKIKKVNNYQRLDLKRRYQDKFVGGLRQNQRKYQKNGVLKFKYRMAQSELQLENSQVYNTYIHSLSRSFHVDIVLDSDDEEVQIQQERNIEIPSIEECTQQRLTTLIRELFGFEKFRQGQFQVIMKILNHQSTIFVSETASGKSLTYIISSLIMAKHSQSMSIVISPLIALILDQLQHLPFQLPAACISSLINYEQRNKILELVKTNQVKLLFLTPEMIMTDILFHIKQFPRINFVCIDEAHCLSQLSQNFRTSYLTLAQIIKGQISYNTPKLQPNILCLTATANNQTIESLTKKLSIKNVVKSSSTLNKNLYITITRQIGPDSKFRALVDYLNTKEVKGCQGILIYCRAKYLIDKVFHYLSNSLINAVIFHGGLANKQKTRIISEFKDRTIKIIISTTALGMGLDFEHLDCIIHFNMPKSLESFVQETGRAGRRQTRAYCQLFLDESDFFMERNYILADELEEQSMKAIVNSIERSQGGRTIRKSKQKTKADKNKFDEQQMQRIIKKAALGIERIEEEDNDEQLIDASEQESNNHEQDSRLLSNSKWAPLYYLRVKELSEKTYLREQALLTILIKLAEYLNQQVTQDSNVQVLKIHPLSHEILKLSFFKTNEKQLIESKQFGQFYRKLVDIPQGKNSKPACKKVSGSYHIHIIQKCNQLQMTPIQLMSRVYEISNQFVMKVQFVTEVYVFSINEKVEINQNNSSRLVKYKEVVQRISNRAFQREVINKVNQIQKTTMIKLEVFYSLAFNYSQITINELLKKKLIIDRSSLIPSDNIMNQITKYFNMELNSFYNYIAETEDEQQREMFLPTENIQGHQINNVYEHTKLFFKHQFSNLRDINNREEATKKKEAIVDEYKDGKVITRVFLGVNEEKSSRFIFGEHTYWRKFHKKKYFSLLKTIRELIEKCREDIVSC